MTTTARYRQLVERMRAEVSASADKRFLPDLEHFDALQARFAPVVGDDDAAALAWLVATMSCAPVMPQYDAARAVERLLDRMSAA